MSLGGSKRDPDLLEAVVALIDAEAEGMPVIIDSEGVLKALLGYVPAGIAQAAVQRAMLATGISGVDDMEARQEELSVAIRIFMDGFIIATRYAREHQDP